MKDDQKFIADEIVNHFKKIKGIHISVNELYNLFRHFNESDIRYVIAMLSIKGILSNQSATPYTIREAGQVQYILTDKGWIYEGWVNLEEEERRSEKDKSDRIDLEMANLKSSIDTNNALTKTNNRIKRWTMVNAVAAALLFITSLLQCGRSQSQELRLIRESLQGQERSLEMNRIYLQGIHYYLFAPKDTNGVKPDPRQKVPN